MGYGLPLSEIMISTLSVRHGMGTEIGAATSVTPVSAVHAINRAYYFPLYIDRTLTAFKLWWGNGATANGNTDIGVYNSVNGEPAGLVIASGSTVQDGAKLNAIQEVDIANTVLTGPALYFIGLATNSATSTYWASALGSTSIARHAGVMMQSSGAFPLPATAAPIVTTGVSAICCGVAARLLTGP